MKKGASRATGETIPVFVGPIEAGHAVVLGRPETVAMFGSLLSASSGPLTALRSALVGLPAFQSTTADLTGGLVRLTDRSRQLLAEHGAVIGGDGAVLGVARGADGRFAGVLSFEEVGRFAGVGANLPMLLSAVALQAQLAAIERKLDDIQTDVATLIRESRIKVLGESRAVIEILQDVHSDVLETGLLTDDDWARVSGVEETVRTLHFQTRAHLEDIVRGLGDPDGRLRARVASLGKVLRHDRLRFWLQLHIVAEAALARWEILRLDRLARQGDSRLGREADEIGDNLASRRQFADQLGERLAAQVGSDVDLNLFDRLRLLQQARLRSMLEQLEGLVVAFHSAGHPIATSTAPRTGLGSPKESVDWQALVKGIRRRSASPVRRLGTAAQRAGRAAARRLEKPLLDDEAEDD